MQVGEIEEEYEITQVIDRILTNQNGINAFLGKYIFQCSAVRRTPSHEDYDNKKDYTPGNDVLEELYGDAKFESKIEEEESNAYPEYNEEVKNNCEENEFNNITNKLANNIYTYSDRADYTYGRISRLSRKLKKNKNTEFNMFTLAYKKPIKSIIYDGMTAGYKFHCGYYFDFPLESYFIPSDVSKINTSECVYFSAYDPASTGMNYTKPASIKYNIGLSRWEMYVYRNNTMELYAYTNETSIANLSELSEDIWTCEVPDYTGTNSIGFISYKLHSGDEYLKLSNTNTDLDGFFLSAIYSPLGFITFLNGINTLSFIKAENDNFVYIYWIDIENNKTIPCFKSTEKITFAADIVDALLGGGTDVSGNEISKLEWEAVEGSPASNNNLPIFEKLIVK